MPIKQSTTMKYHQKIKIYAKIRYRANVDREIKWSTNHIL